MKKIGRPKIATNDKKTFSLYFSQSNRIYLDKCGGSSELDSLLDFMRKNKLSFRNVLLILQNKERHIDLSNDVKTLALKLGLIEEIK